MKPFNKESNAIPEHLRQDYFASLDGLRGIAILIVVLVHFGLNHYLRFLHIRIDSRFGVDIFFVLSGFLITTKLLKEKSERGRISLRNFYLRRALRIIPVVYLYLIVLIALSLLGGVMISKKDFLYSFLFLKNLPIPNERFTAHLWTLAVEWQFYLVFPLLITYLSINRTLFLCLFIVLVFPLLSIIYTYGNLQGASGPFNFLMKGINYSFWKGPIILLVGAVASILSFKGVIKHHWKGPHFQSLLLFMLALLFNIKNSPLYLPYVSQWAGAILIALVILLNLASDNSLSRLLQTNKLRQLGVLSYSIYIWQQLFIGWYFYLPGLRHFNQLPIYVLMIIKISFITVIAYASYCLYERQLLRMKEKW
ncbi:acyltransferase family protein [Desertivirga brevis]|uniref:acyltransferase family protein n=1 Tax=Desertivirga brevis TaxID=2810310 RepID=UPI001A96952B|nr:acyltransferase [Pedobacter sp. SYSU D00873]